jgi:serine/threonine protein kinase
MTDRHGTSSLQTSAVCWVVQSLQTAPSVIVHTAERICALQAPEQFEGRPVSERVDQWAFGVLLWEMFTGQLPWADLDHPMQVRVHE